MVEIYTEVSPVTSPTALATLKWLDKGPKYHFTSKLVTRMRHWDFPGYLRGLLRAHAIRLLECSCGSRITCDEKPPLEQGSRDHDCNSSGNIKMTIRVN